jgi:hypothetical protein
MPRALEVVGRQALPDLRIGIEDPDEVTSHGKRVVPFATSR